MRENQIQKKCIEKAEEADVLVYKVVSPGRRGFPDVLLAFNNKNVSEYVDWDELEKILKGE